MYSRKKLQHVSQNFLYYNYTDFKKNYRSFFEFLRYICLTEKGRAAVAHGKVWARPQAKLAAHSRSPNWLART